MESYELVRFPVEQKFRDVVEQAEDTLFIATPYIKSYGVESVLRNTTARKLKLLTNLELANVSGSGFDLESLLKFWDRFDLTVSSLGKLHAKVYVADKKLAFLTSANLTRGGLRENYEYGIILRDARTVQLILDDLDMYFRLGNIFGRALAEQMQRDIADIRVLQKQIQQSQEAKRLNQLLRNKTDTLQTKILENRVRGKTVNSIFSDTIIYLLRTREPMSTEELHPFIQDIHPDICDDSIDRVINGQRFGKKWKHMVRNAQQSLKQNKVIELRGDKWHLAI